jgi:predicted phage terminase large subunit-like protein
MSLEAEAGPGVIVGALKWLRTYFPDAFTDDFADCHIRFWKWVEALKASEYQRPLIEAWSRGYGKSTALEASVVLMAVRQSRKFVLYVSETQEQANAHVASIARKLVELGYSPKLDEMGRTAAWRRNQLQLNDIVVAAYGLEGAIRGIKVGNVRPDLIIFDDIDREDDTPETVTDKIEAIQTKILPAMSPFGTVLGLQNLIHDNSIFTQLMFDQVDMLNDRIPAEPEKAIDGLIVQPTYDETLGKNINKIIAGTARWGRISLEVCQRYIISYGLHAFLREFQHESTRSGGYFFDTRAVKIIKELPKDRYGRAIHLRVCLAFDLAATEGAGDYTVATLWATPDEGQTFIVLDMVRGQWSTEKVRRTIRKLACDVADRFPARYTIFVPQDAGGGGKWQRDDIVALLAGLNVLTSTMQGSKAVRARGVADDVNVGNVSLLEDTSLHRWNRDWLIEHDRFREDGKHGHDDIVDTSSDAHRLLKRSDITVTGGIEVNPEHRYNEGLKATSALIYARPRESQMSDDEWAAQFDKPIRDFAENRR